MSDESTVDVTSILYALRRVQASIQWRPDRAAQHLEKRKRQGHIGPETTLAEYQAIIAAVLHHPDAFVYVYRFGHSDYPVITAPVRGRTWLVMFGLDGILETAFPPDDPATYFGGDPRYIAVGPIKELEL